MLNRNHTAIRHWRSHIKGFVEFIFIIEPPAIWAEGERDEVREAFDRLEGSTRCYQKLTSAFNTRLQGITGFLNALIGA